MSEPVRCAWAGSAPEYVAYHDDEWGRPLRGGTALFDRLKEEGPGFLRLPATYNLAAAYVEKYDPDSDRRAEELLTHVKTNLPEAPLQTVPKVALNAQAAGLLAYLAVERLEPARADRRPAKDSVVVETARAGRGPMQGTGRGPIPSSPRERVRGPAADETVGRRLPDPRGGGHFGDPLTVHQYHAGMKPPPVRAGRKGVNATQQAADDFAAKMMYGTKAAKKPAKKTAKRR